MKVVKKTKESYAKNLVFSSHTTYISITQLQKQIFQHTLPVSVSIFSRILPYTVYHLNLNENAINDVTTKEIIRNLGKEISFHEICHFISSADRAEI